MLTFDNDTVQRVRDISIRFGVPEHHITIPMVNAQVSDYNFTNDIAIQILSYLYNEHENIVVYGNDAPTRMISHAMMNAIDERINAFDEDRMDDGDPSTNRELLREYVYTDRYQTPLTPPALTRSTPLSTPPQEDTDMTDDWSVPPHPAWENWN